MSSAITAAVIVGGSAMYGANKASKATKQAAAMQAAESQRAQEESQRYQEQQLGVAKGYLDPYLDRYSNPELLDRFSNFGTEGAGADLLSQMNSLAQGGLSTEYKEDPAYLWRQAQQEEALNAQLANRGLYGSREGINALSDSNMALSGEEADKQYLRSVDDYNRQQANLTNQYNYQYGNILDQVNMGYNATQGLASMTAGVGGVVGGQILESGLSSAANTAALNAQAGQQLGAGYAGLGSAVGSGITDYKMAPYIDEILSGRTGGLSPTLKTRGWGTGINQTQGQNYNLGTQGLFNNSALSGSILR